MILALASASHSGAAQVKPGWQTEWEKVLEAAKKEGQVAVYISGYEEILPEFQKEYPEIKVVPTTGRGSQVGQRLLAERRAEKYLADVVSAGGVTTYQQLFPAKVFDPIKPALLLPEITDTSNGYQGKHHYSDPENLYIFDYVATATYGAISYNTVSHQRISNPTGICSRRNGRGKSSHAMFGFPAPARAMRACFTTCPMSVRRTSRNFTARWT